MNAAFKVFDRHGGVIALQAVMQLASDLGFKDTIQRATDLSSVS